ncbi:spermidine/putrescine ABC transporter permease [Clostridia bacterium]|nr:spermidine/putrescine ABC transporter permease [Clostridia bacterium]
MWKIGKRVYITLLFSFLYLPIAVMIAFSFNASKSRTIFSGFTLDWYRNLFNNQSTLRALALTLVLAFLSAIIATVIGTMASVGVNRMRRGSRAAVMNVSYLPIVNPEILAGVSMMLLFVVMKQGFEFIGAHWIAKDLIGLPSLLIAHVTFNLPYVLFNVAPKVRRMDMRLYDAAMDLGCNERQSFFKVVLPEIMPAVLSSFLICLTYSFDDFTISYFNAGNEQTLPIAIYSMTRKKVSPEINALSTIMFGVILTIILVANYRERMANQPRTAGKRKFKPKHLIAPALAAIVTLSLVVGPLISSLGMSPTVDVEVVDNGYDWQRLADKNITLNVYNWGEYIADGVDGESLDVNAAFEALTGIHVNYTTFDSNESLYAKLKSGGAKYDVVIPSDYMIGKMAAEGLIAPLDFENIPNFELVGGEYTGRSYDPEDAYSVPYMWGYVGIIYNTTMVEEEPDSWDALWDERYKNQILMFDNSRDAFGIALRKLNLSLNPTDTAQIDAAARELMAQKNVVQAYVMDQIFDKMEGGEAALAPYYAGDAITMIEENPDLAFAVPSEGTNYFVDALCIPADTANKQAAEMYINFMCEPEVSAENSSFIGYSTPITDALELLDEEVREDEIAYPSEEVLANTESFDVLPDELNRYMDKSWSDMRGGNEEGGGWIIPLLLLAAIIATVVVTVVNRNRRKRRVW